MSTDVGSTAPECVEFTGLVGKGGKTENPKNPSKLSPETECGCSRDGPKPPKDGVPTRLRSYQTRSIFRALPKYSSRKKAQVPRG